MKALIVYYSSTGNTEEVSTVLEECLCKRNVECKRLRITSIEESEQSSNLLFKVVRSLTGKETPIKNCKFNPDDYDYIFMGTPVWAAQPTPSFNAFLNQLPEMHGQKICPFVTMGGMGDKSTIAKIRRKVEAKGGCMHASLSLKMDKGVMEEHVNSIEDFIQTQVMENEAALH